MRVWRVLFVSGLCVVAALLCAYSGRSFLRHVAREVPLRPECHNAVGNFSAADGQNSVAYHACLVERAKLFFDRDYAETRDISKAFLTLLTAVFPRFNHVFGEDRRSPQVGLVATCPDDLLLGVPIDRDSRVWGCARADDAGCGIRVVLPSGRLLGFRGRCRTVVSLFWIQLRSRPCVPSRGGNHFAGRWTGSSGGRSNRLSPVPCGVSPACACSGRRCAPPLNRQVVM